MKKLFTSKSLLKGAVIGTVAASILATGVLASGNYGTSSMNTPFITTDPTINFRVSGSTTVYPIMSAWMSSTPGTMGKSSNGPFQNSATAYNGVIADVQAQGSGYGTQDIVDEAVDVGMSSSNTKILAGTTAYAIARDGIAMIVNSASVNLTDIPKAQLKGIYDGTITNWSAVGAGTASGTIVPISRDSNSGTYASFKDNTSTTFAGVASNHFYVANWDIVNAVENTPNSIGYVGMGFASSIPSGAGATVLTLDGKAANQQNVYTGNYGISRFLWVLEKTTLSGSNTAVVNNRPIADALVQYATSRAGQNAVQAQGFVKYFVDQDVNHDGKISISDVAKVGLKWGQTGASGWINEDVNQDGKISISDVAKIGLWWGLTAGTYGNTMTSGNTMVK